jgi:glutathione synthase/RimK-type ligase-like ATP-grasp enzyme
MMPTADVALLTSSRYTSPVADEGDWYQANILRDDDLLSAALLERGLSSVRMDWAQPDVDWSAFKCLVFRTTWDYFDRYPEFTAWLKRVSEQTILINSAETIWWNIDKHYLGELAYRDIQIVESRYIDIGSQETLKDLLAETGWGEAVIKPCISGGARHTHRVNQSNAQEIETLLRPVLDAEAFILQPFQQQVVEQGEDTLMVFNGKYTHAVRKIAKAGDFRVQDDFGGKVYDYTPTQDQIDLAERAVAACPQLPVYGRVDMVRDNRGQLAIMEVELLEPELWLRNHPPSAAPFAEGIVRVLTAGSRS